jgi:hypothetical protein
MNSFHYKERWDLDSSLPEEEVRRKEPRNMLVIKK